MERQVGLVRGTRWPDGSSAVHMVARTSKGTWFRYEVAANNRSSYADMKPVQGGGSQPKLARGVWWFIQKTIRWTRSRCKVAAHNRSLHAGFGGLARRPSGGRGLGVRDRGCELHHVYPDDPDCTIRMIRISHPEVPDCGIRKFRTRGAEEPQPGGHVAWLQGLRGRKAIL